MRCTNKVRVITAVMSKLVWKEGKKKPSELETCCRPTTKKPGEEALLPLRVVASELFLSQAPKPHCAPTAGNYQVKCGSTWIIQWGCCTIKSRSNQPMLPNRHSSVHTWKVRANHLSRSHPDPPQPGPPLHKSDQDRTTKGTHPGYTFPSVVYSSACFHVI